MRFTQLHFGLGLALTLSFALVHGAPIAYSKLPARSSQFGARNLLGRNVSDVVPSNTISAAHPKRTSSDTHHAGDDAGEPAQKTDKDAQQLRALSTSVAELLPKADNKWALDILEFRDPIRDKLQEWNDIGSPTAEQKKELEAFIVQKKKALVDFEKKVLKKTAAD